MSGRGDVFALVVQQGMLVVSGKGETVPPSAQPGMAEHRGTTGPGIDHAAHAVMVHPFGVATDGGSETQGVAAEPMEDLGGGADPVSQLVVVGIGAVETPQYTDPTGRASAPHGVFQGCKTVPGARAQLHIGAHQFIVDPQVVAPERHLHTRPHKEAVYEQGFPLVTTRVHHLIAEHGKGIAQTISVQHLVVVHAAVGVREG